MYVHRVTNLNREDDIQIRLTDGTTHLYQAGVDTMTNELKYDPELPYAFVSPTRVYARFAIRDDADIWQERLGVGEVVDTTPKPKIPEGAEFILVETEDVAKDIYQRVEDKHEDAGFYWYRAIDSMAYGHDEMPDMIGDAEVTVLVRKEDS